MVYFAQRLSFCCNSNDSDAYCYLCLSAENFFSLAVVFRSIWRQKAAGKSCVGNEIYRLMGV